MENPTIAMSESLVSDIDARVQGANSRSEWVRGGARMRLELENAVENSSTDASELSEEWWQDVLYNAAREYLREHRTRNEHEHSVEAD